MAVDLTRTQLLYGQWPRGAKRRRDAWRELHTAHDMFAAMGATGERARARTPETAVDLPPQETRAPDLAAAGASDGETAAQRFIIPSTVDYHLRKLHVTSRAQLAGLLRSGPGAVADHQALAQSRTSALR
jgi:DNA-binding CsgD family transcriptional regulator